MPTKHLLINGKVQGVFYRATAKEMAEKLGLTGWVKNTSEGNVEAVISGEEQPVKKFIDWCRHGPSGAKVTHVEVMEAQEENFWDFTIIRG